MSHDLRCYVGHCYFFFLHCLSASRSNRFSWVSCFYSLLTAHVATHVHQVKRRSASANYLQQFRACLMDVRLPQGTLRRGVITTRTKKRDLLLSGAGGKLNLCLAGHAFQTCGRQFAHHPVDAGGVILPVLDTGTHALFAPDTSIQMKGRSKE